MTAGKGAKKIDFKGYINSSYLSKWVIVGILIGIVAGLGAAAFYYLIQFASDNFLGRITGIYPPNPAGELPSPISSSPHYFLIPLSLALGGLIVGLLIFFFAPEAEGHGTDAAIDAFHNRNGVIRKRVPLVKMIASAITIGSGGSGGREGPTAQISAGFGSYVATVFGMSNRDRRIAVAAGIGAGIGAIFRSPFAGAILSAEILYSGGDMEVEALTPAFIASPVGYVIFASFTNFSPIFSLSSQYTFNHPLNLLLYAILGIICGLMGKFYSSFFYWVKGLFSRLKVKKFLKPMIGGAVAGVVAMFFPQTLGMSYGYLQFLMDGNLKSAEPVFFLVPIVLALVMIAFAKIVATSFTISSGGSAGVFAPSLVIGGFLGAATWAGINMISPSLVLSPAPFVLVGMMALYAGVGRTPIAVILMVSEMTGSLEVMVPAMIAVVISYYIVGYKSSIYRSQVRNRSDSPAHRGEYNIPVLTYLTAKDAISGRPLTIDPSTSVADALKIMEDDRITGVPVTENGRLVGIVTKSDLIQVRLIHQDMESVSHVMTKNVVYGYPDDSLLEIMRKLSVNNISHIPIVDKENLNVIGMVTLNGIYRAHQQFLARNTT
ncbi:MAG: chloride channel protein [Candidatus Thermoplasmatota archaeon]|nr:chloride channel protein [Candidatus Thermoplasmatota archaeon]MCL5789508.1 chloride channel protein [Candidatus Thermoplasmatota archaeon]